MTDTDLDRWLNTRVVSCFAERADAVEFASQLSGWDTGRIAVERCGRYSRQWQVVERRWIAA